MTDLSPCPACGSANLDTFSRVLNVRVYVAGCRDCGLYGPHDDEKFTKWRALCRAVSGGWTPVSEGLPEDGAECELTIELESGRTYISSYIFEGGRWVPADGVGPLMLWPVVAFRPVNYGREPYEGPE